MKEKISRRKLANYAVDQIQQGAKLSGLLDQIAAYLIESRRLRESGLVVRAIEDELAARGIVIARVTTAHALTDKLRNEIIERIHASKVYVEEIVDPQILGGVKIETPGQSLDATMQRKLLALSQAKV